MPAMAEPDGNTATATTPVPRFRWLKRGLLTAAALLVLLVGLRLYWGQAMQARVDRVVADIHDRGEPIHPDDLNYQHLEAHQNAATYLMQALNRWPSVPGTYQRIDDTDWYLEGPEAGHTDPITDNPAYLDTCEPALDLVRQAAALDKADWLGRPIPSDYNDYINSGMRHLGDRRRLARLMQDAARRALDAGQTRRAIEILGLIDAAGDKAALNPVGLIDVLVGWSIHAIVHDTIQEQLPALPDQALRDPATREALTRLLEQLRDEGPHRRATTRALMIERWAMQRYMTQRIDGSLNLGSFYGSDPYADLLLETPILNTAFAPLFNHTLVYQLKSATDQITRFTTTDNARDAVDLSLGPDAEAVYRQRPWLYPIIGELWFTDPVAVYYRYTAMRRMAAAAIAIRLYQADHDGTRPETLEALVPDYLPAVPMDPYVGDRPIGYKPDGVVPKTYDEIDPWYEPLTKEERDALPLRPFPLLYCVGMDFKDHGGRLVIDDYGEFDHVSGWSDDEDKDLWFLLVPEPEPLPVEPDDDDFTY